MPPGRHSAETPVFVKPTTVGGDLPNAARIASEDLDVWFHILGQIRDVEVIAVGRAIRELPRLRKTYAGGRWRKLKGLATVELEDGSIHVAEVHWYEAHGIGRHEMKIKRFLE